MLSSAAAEPSGCAIHGATTSRCTGYLGSMKQSGDIANPQTALFLMPPPHSAQALP